MTALVARSSDSPSSSLPADPHAGLNSAQRQAATHGAVDAQGRVRADPLLIIAGAGTGKTQTLSHRAAHLVLGGVDPARILLLTFSRRAAEEMTRRAEGIVRGALGVAPDTAAGALRLPWSGTFHSVANRLLREYHANVGLDAQFSIVDRGDAADLLDVCRHELHLSSRGKRFPKKQTALAVYSRVVNTQGALADVLTEAFPWCAEWHDELKRLFAAYVAAKQATASLDYDDLLLYWHHLMAEPALAQAVGARFDHVLVDEYQDTNVLQAAIVRAMKPDGTGVTVVGDDAQSIYSFRAASIDNILDFPQQYTPAARVIKLEENYRSTQPVLDAANAVIGQASRGYTKQLTAHRGGGTKPCFVTVEDDHNQSLYVVDTVLANREAGQRLRDQAVLFRVSHHADALEVELIRRNIPYRKYGGLKFLESGHIKDVLAVLRWADNPRNRIAAFRCCQLVPGIGPKAAEAIFGHLETHNFELIALAGHTPRVAGLDAEVWQALAGLLGQAADTATDWHGQLAAVRGWYTPLLANRHDNADARIGDLDQLERISQRFATREQFLTELTLDPPAATGDESGAPLLDEDFLILSTIHSAKGQEWDSVFVLNVADGNLPSEFATGDAGKTEEERRLTYVAMTRARDQLHLLAPLKYYVPEQPRYGSRHVYGARSRFFPDAVMGHFDARTWPAGAQAPTAARGPAPAATVDVGARLRAMWD